MSPGPLLRLVRPAAALVIALSTALLVAGCGEKKKDRAALTTAALVNNGEVSLAQVNLALQQQRSLRPEQADAASRLILERLIDQTLAMQRAERDGLEREPRVQLQLDAARREVLARAFVEKAVDDAPKPTPEEIRRHYDERPALYRQRQLFNVLELLVEVAPEQAPALRDKLAAAANLQEFTEYLKANGLRFASSQTQRGAEQFAPGTLEALLKMKDGQVSVQQSAAGLQVFVLLSSRPQPLGEEQARPLIERALLAERKRRIVEEQVKSLRASGRIEYLGSYAKGPKPAAAPASSIDVGIEGGATR